MVQLLHSCGPLFKIIRACGPQPARNTYFRPKIIAFSKKKKRSSLGIGLRNTYFRPKIIAFSKKKKVFTWNRSQVLNPSLAMPCYTCYTSVPSLAMPCYTRLPLLVLYKDCGPRAHSWTKLSRETNSKSVRPGTFGII